MRSVFAAGLGAALARLSGAAGADAPLTMGQAAAKEKEKKKPAKVYTEDDLRGAGRGTLSNPGADGGSATAGTPATAASPAAGASGAAGEKKADDKTAAPAEKPKTEEEQHAEREKEWRDKLAQAQADVTTWSAEVTRLQSVMNDNTGPMYGAGRAARAESLENAKRQLAAAQQTVETLQEEGR